MTDAPDLDETSRDLSRRSWMTMIWFILAAIGAVISVFTLPRGIVGLLVIGADHTTSIVLTIIGAVVTVAVLFLIWKWARSFRTQRSMKRDFDERIAEAAGIVDAGDTDEGLTPQRT